MATRIDIRAFEPRDAERVAALNREWLAHYDLLEEADEVFLRDPSAAVIERGGAMLVAVRVDVDSGARFEGQDPDKKARPEEIVGTAAVRPTAKPREMELLKLAVAASAQGQGVGHRLIEASLDAARARGAERVVLVSSCRLVAALRLYERFGFEYKPLPPDQPYATADVYMERPLISARTPTPR